MSEILTVGGSYNGAPGGVSIPSAFSSSVNSLLQSYLDGASVNGSFGPTTAGGLYQGVSAGNLIVSVTGAVTVDSYLETTAAFGASSDVTYTNNTVTAQTVIGAGGSNSISEQVNNQSITAFTAGSDTIAFYSGSGSDTVNVDNGNATTKVFVEGGNNVEVSVTGGYAQVLFFPNSGGNVTFINASSNAQTVYGGEYSSTEFSPNSISVYGGVGGGVYIGGRAGDNLLVGGPGAVTLGGGGNGDTLVGSAASGDVLATGIGIETLLATSTSGSTQFSIGLNNSDGTQGYASGIASTDGSGNQVFFIGYAQGETLTGSTVSGATNFYNVFADSTAGYTGGASLTITDFASSNSYLSILNSQLGTGDATIETVTAVPGGSSEVWLTDGTTITFKGVSSDNLNYSIGGSSVSYKD